jgi:hypothetical protein
MLLSGIDKVSHAAHQVPRPRMFSRGQPMSGDDPLCCQSGYQKMPIRRHSMYRPDAFHNEKAGQEAGSTNTMRLLRQWPEASHLVHVAFKCNVPSLPTRYTVPLWLVSLELPIELAISRSSLPLAAIPPNGSTGSPVLHTQCNWSRAPLEIADRPLTAR